MTTSSRWSIAVYFTDAKGVLYLDSNEASPRSALARLASEGAYDAEKAVWYPPWRIKEARVKPVGGEVR